jgi:NaMN:DMB phosphoribosyltransferase
MAAGREEAMICAGCGHAGASETGLCGSCAATLMRQGLAYQPAGKTSDQEEGYMADIITTQKKKVLRHLELYGSIDPVQALSEYGVFRLAARIDELRRDAYEIETHLVKTVNRFGEDVRFGRYVLHRPAERG